jgi:hypothetical protein
MTITIFASKIASHIPWLPLLEIDLCLQYQ